MTVSPNIDQRLARIRPADIPFPPEEYLSSDPLALDVEAEDVLWNEFMANAGLHRLPPSIRGKCVVIDLDDTLLPSDYTSDAPWDENLSASAAPAFLRKKLKTDRLRTLAALFKFWIDHFDGHPPMLAFEDPWYSPLLHKPDPISPTCA